MNHHDMSVRWHPIFVVLVSTSEPGQMLKITSIKLKSNSNQTMSYGFNLTPTSGVMWPEPNHSLEVPKPTPTSEVTWLQPKTHFRSHMTTTQHPLQKSHDFNPCNTHFRKYMIATIHSKSHMTTPFQTETMESSDFIQLQLWGS